MVFDNTTGTEDNVIERAESVKDEIPVLAELLEIAKRLDNKLEDWKNAAPSSVSEPEELERWTEDHE